MLGVKFGQKDYVLTILKDVEDEIYRSPALKFKFPWFSDPVLASERLAQIIKLSRDQQAQLTAATSVLRGWVLTNAASYTTHGRSPPSSIDCRILAFGQIFPAVVVTDDLGMHLLAGDFDIVVWHGHELLRKMLTAKVVNNDLVREIFEALEANGDLPHTWQHSRHVAFSKIFGPPPKS